MLLKSIALLTLVLSAFVIVATLLAEVRANAWWVRVFDFPRLQLMAVGFLTLAGMAMLRPFPLGSAWGATTAILLFGALGWQAHRVRPFTIFAGRAVPDFEACQQDEVLSEPIGVLVANVLYENRDAETLERLLAHRKPDLILLSEVDDWWAERVRGWDEFPHRLIDARAKGLGIAALSRHPLIEAEIRELVSSHRASTHAIVELPGGKRIRWIGVHPAPPGLERQDGERMDSKPRDAELLVVAKLTAESDLPVIVCGDFNDVAWSHTTRLMKRTGRLLDPRRGRGLYCSYHADHKLWRYPIDHVLVSPHFVLGGLSILPSIGSDHLPLWAELALRSEKAPAPELHAGDQAEARRIRESAKEVQQEERDAKSGSDRQSKDR